MRRLVLILAILATAVPTIAPHSAYARGGHSYGRHK